jgi:hypothetical protein
VVQIKSCEGCSIGRASNMRVSSGFCYWIKAQCPTFIKKYHCKTCGNNLTFDEIMNHKHGVFEVVSN